MGYKLECYMYSSLLYSDFYVNFVVVFHGSSIFKIYFDGSGTVTYEYNYFRNPNRVVALSGNSVDNFGKKLKQELRRRNNKLQ